LSNLQSHDHETRCCTFGLGGTYTVGIYSPGKALVVYDIRRHVYSSSAESHAAVLRMVNLSNCTVTSYHALFICYQSQSYLHLASRIAHTFSDCVAGAAIVCVESLWSYMRPENDIAQVESMREPSRGKMSSGTTSTPQALDG
jgi:hypothetical protein